MILANNMIEYLKNDLVTTLWKAIIFFFFYIIVVESVGAYNAYIVNSNEYWPNLSEFSSNVISYFKYFLATIVLAFMKDLIISLPIAKFYSKKFIINASKFFKSTGILYSNSLNTSSMHVNYLDDFIEMFFSSAEGRVSLFNPDKNLFKIDGDKISPVLISLLSAIEKGKIIELHINVDDLSDFEDFKTKLVQIGKLGVLKTNIVTIHPETPRFASYFKKEGNLHVPAYFMWRPRISPYNDKLVHIIKDKHINEISHGFTDFRNEISNLINLSNTTPNYNLK
jgi:hypothetical protein